MRVIALCAIRRDALYLPGQELDLPDDTAAALARRDPPAVTIVNATARTKVNEFDLADSVKKLVPQIHACSDATLLRALEQAELNNDPPRKGVLEAVAERLATLEANSGGGEDGTKESDGE
jgi:hypothetical protein